MKLASVNLLLFVSLLTFFSCATPTKVINIKNVTKIQGDYFFYALPETHYLLRLKAKETVFKRGPFYLYAEKFLGIKDAPSKDFVKWEIVNSEIETYQTIDSSNIYYVQQGKNKLDISALHEKQLIQPICFNNKIIDLQNKHNILSEDGLFVDNSTKKNVVQREETVYKTVKRDSGSVTVTSKEKRISTRTAEEKAEEAANAIYKLRKRRIKLIEGIEKSTFGSSNRTFAKQYPDGESMKIMLQRMDSLEQDLLAMFTGRKYSNCHEYNFTLNPAASTSKDGFTICSFSETDGILDASQNNGAPIIINSKANRLPGILSVLNFPKENVFNSLVYRIPVQTNVKVSYNNSVINSKNIFVHQFGAIVSVPFK